MEWQDVIYMDGYENLVRRESGKHSKFAQREIGGVQYLLKIFDKCTDDKRTVIDRFRNLSYEGVNAFPTGKVYVYDRDEGYVSKYYDGAVDFSDDLCSIIPYDVRYQATLDICSQLRFLHMNEFIANDIRLANNLVSFRDRCGLMIDFEDMILEDDYKVKSTYYRFYKKGYNEKLPPSKWDDVKKQFICSVSLLLAQDFETLILCRDEYDFLNKFSFDSELYEFTNQLFRDDKVIYFDEIAPKFRDEEKVRSYIKSMKS